MKIQRTKNAARNIFFEGILKSYEILCPFLMRSLMLYYLGVEYLGVTSLFTSILQVLNLAELGVGQAMTFSFYKPIAEDDHPTICALMQLYRRFYRIIGIVIAVVGVGLTPFLRFLVKGNVPTDLNLYVLYYMNLSVTVLSYWLFAYKNSLLNAHQRNDVISKVTLGVNTMQYTLMVVGIYVLRSYYFYLSARILSQVIANVMTAVVVTKMYPHYKPVGKLPKEEIQGITHRIRDLFTARVSAVVLFSADSIVISAFLGLAPLAVYQNYYTILNSVRGVMGIIGNACMGGIGNSLVTETKEKNYGDFNKLSFLYLWLAGVTACMLLCVYQPFMLIWVKKEDLMLPLTAVICFAVYYYILEMNRLLNLYKDAAGIWHEDRFRPLTAAVVNIVLNLLTVRTWGLFGVILSSVVATTFVEIPWLLHNLFHLLFPRDRLWKYVRTISAYTCCVIAACVVSLLICQKIELGAWLNVLVCAAVSFTIPNLFFVCLFHRREAFRDSVLLIRKMITSFLPSKRSNGV